MPMDPQTLVEEAQKRPEMSNPVVLDLSEEAFQQWRHQPVSQAFLLFLAHRSRQLRYEIAEAYLTNTMDRADAEGLKGRIIECEDLCGVKLSDIQRFYGKQSDQPAREE